MSVDVDQSRFVTIREFCKRSTLSRGSVYNEIGRGNLPRPTRLTRNRVAFPASVVEAWLASKTSPAPSNAEAA